MYESKHDLVERADYHPPWANTSIISIAGSSGSGKTSLALAIVASLNLPWVIILSMVSCPYPHVCMATHLIGLILQTFDR